jgi:hypothetical protein
MDVPTKEFVLAGSLEELKAKGRFVVHGGHRPILVLYDRGRRKISVCVRLRGGAGRTRTSNQTIISRQL